MKSLLALRASAGSGKTTRLVSRYLELLANGAKVNEILCLTFTNKAAAEMKERVDSALEEPIGALERFGIRIDQLTSERLKSYRLLINDAPILTFDAFFNRILRSFCFYAGVPLSYEISSKAIEPNAFLLNLSELDRWRLARFLKDYNLTLDSLMNNFEQFFELPSLLNANDAKFNSDIVINLANIIKTDVLKYEKASKSAKNAVDFRNVKELLDKGKTWLTKDELNDYSFFSAVPFSENSKHNFTYLKIALKEWFSAKEAMFFSYIANWFDSYKKTKKDRLKIDGFCSYSDVTRAVWELLCSENALSSDFLYFRLDGRITHILIDEFQDTSRLQYEILSPLIEEIISGEGRLGGRTFFYVGDPKQSIYRFRGGVSALFDELANTISNIDVEELESGYRLFANNMQFVNEVFGKLFNGYSNQLVGNMQKQSGGYVEVCESDDITNEVVLKVKYLLECGVKASCIAILGFKNDECEQIADALLEEGIIALRETTTKLITQRNAKAIIKWLQYCVFGKRLSGINALKLFGEDFLKLESFSAKIDIRQSAVNCIFAIMKQFEIFSADAFALLERANTYETVLDFANKIEDDDTVFNSDGKDGVRVLTIHKSKGLEFDYVILADRMTQATNQDRLHFIEFDGAKPCRVWRKDTMREVFDKDYAFAKRKRELESEEDDRNALYVACTREKRGLIIVKKQQKSAFDILDIKPFVNGEIVPVAIDNNEQQLINIDKIQWYDLGRQDVVKKEKNNDNAVLVGIAAHCAMEFWQNLQDKNQLFELVMSKVKNVDIANNGIQIADTMMSNVKFLEMLQNKQIFKEIAFRLQGKVGRIDMLLLDSDESFVIDYKSGFGGDEIYKNQLDYYKYAVGILCDKVAKTALLRKDGLRFI